MRYPCSCSPRAICTGGLEAIRREAVLFCGFFLGKGDVFAHVGKKQNLENLKDDLRRIGGSGTDIACGSR